MPPIRFLDSPSDVFFFCFLPDLRTGSPVFIGRVSRENALPRIFVAAPMEGRTLHGARSPMDAPMNVDRAPAPRRCCPTCYPRCHRRVSHPFFDARRPAQSRRRDEGELHLERDRHCGAPKDSVRSKSGFRVGDPCTADYLPLKADDICVPGTPPRPTGGRRASAPNARGGGAPDYAPGYECAV